MQWGCVIFIWGERSSSLHRLCPLFVCQSAVERCKTPVSGVTGHFPEFSLNSARRPVWEQSAVNTIRYRWRPDVTATDERSTKLMRGSRIQLSAWVYKNKALAEFIQTEDKSFLFYCCPSDATWNSYCTYLNTR